MGKLGLFNAESFMRILIFIEEILCYYNVNESLEVVAVYFAYYVVQVKIYIARRFNDSPE